MWWRTRVPAVPFIKSHRDDEKRCSDVRHCFLVNQSLDILIERLTGIAQWPRLERGTGVWSVHRLMLHVGLYRFQILPHEPMDRGASRPRSVSPSTERSSRRTLRAGRKSWILFSRL